MGNHQIASSGESAAPIAPGKRDVANRDLETPRQVTQYDCRLECWKWNRHDPAGVEIWKIFGGQQTNEIM